jgi:iron complex outermembrane receptor protein
VIASAKNIEGKTPPAMPKVSGSVNASYRFDLAAGSLTARAQYTYRGSEWARIFNEPGLDYVKSYSVTDLYFEFAPNGSHLRYSLTATNLFDKAGVNSRYTDPYGTGQTSVQYIPPRQVIGTIAFAF